MKFDNIVGNPPYGTLHIKIFNKSFDILKDAGHLIFIHPSTPFLNGSQSRTHDVSRIKIIISEYKTELTFIDGNVEFDAEFFTPLSITNVTKIKDKNIKVIDEFVGNSTINYDDVNDIYIHGNKLVLGIRDKVIEKSDSSLLDNFHRKGAIGTSYIKLNSVSGHSPVNGKLNPDFYQLLYKIYEHDSSNVVLELATGQNSNGTPMNELAFYNQGEQLNGFDYILTKFARFCLSLTKIHQTLIRNQFRLVPYMDFSRSWSDQELFEYFEFTQDEIDFILDFIPNLYEKDFELYPNKLG